MAPEGGKRNRPMQYEVKRRLFRMHWAGHVQAAIECLEGLGDDKARFRPPPRRARPPPQGPRAADRVLRGAPRPRAPRLQQQGREGQRARRLVAPEARRDGLVEAGQLVERGREGALPGRRVGDVARREKEAALPAEGVRQAVRPAGRRASVTRNRW